MPQRAPKGPRGIAAYEIDMLENLADGPSDWAKGNALTESRVLHARQLCDIFLGRGEQDEVRLASLLANHPQSRALRELVGELRTKYGNRNMSGSPCWVFNKKMFHPTVERTDSHDYAPALRIVEPILKKIVAEIESLTHEPFVRNPRP
jgi:hypothetical protein